MYLLLYNSFNFFHNKCHQNYTYSICHSLLNCLSTATALLSNMLIVLVGFIIASGPVTTLYRTSTPFPCAFLCARSMEISCNYWPQICVCYHITEYDHFSLSSHPEFLRHIFISLPFLPRTVYTTQRCWSLYRKLSQLLLQHRNWFLWKFHLWWLSRQPESICWRKWMWSNLWNIW